MGLTIPGFIAEAVIQSIEAKIMAQYRPRLLLRYVDTFVTINRNDLEYFNTIIKFINASKKNSREEKQNNQVPYLCVLVQRHGDDKRECLPYKLNFC